MEIRNSRPTTLSVLIIINTIIFLLLALLHLYWAFGGELWYGAVLPTNSSGSRRMEPGIAATFVVAFGLLLFAFISLGNRGLWDKHVNRKYFNYGALLLSVIFLLRAVGDFRFVGFFKSVNRTQFAQNDTWFFSPFCLLMAAINLFIFAIGKRRQ